MMRIDANSERVSFIVCHQLELVVIGVQNDLLRPALAGSLLLMQRRSDRLKPVLPGFVG
jgi:hypothetical protein